MENRAIASITVGDVEVPGHLAGVPDGARFLEIGTIDGQVNNAIFCPAPRDDAGPLLLSVHGSGGSCVGGVNGHLVNSLPRMGCAVLAINTRQSGSGANKDNFFAVRNELDAAFAVASHLGYRQIFLHGHSLGNIQALFYAATAFSPAIRGVVLTSMFANLPWKSQHILPPGGEAYQAWADEARRHARQFQFDTLLAPMEDPRGPLAQRMTAGHFLTYRDAFASVAVGTEWIGRIAAPILLLRHPGDTLVVAAEAEAMLDAATSATSLCADASLLTLETMSDSTGLAAHDFADPGDRDLLVDAMADWIGRRT